MTDDPLGRDGLVARARNAVVAGHGALITGSAGAGVSTVLRRAVAKLRSSGLTVVGVHDLATAPPGTVVVADDAETLPPETIDAIRSRVVVGDLVALLAASGRRGSRSLQQLCSAGALVQIDVPALDADDVRAVIASMAGAEPDGATWHSLVADSGGLAGVLVPVLAEALDVGAVEVERGVARLGALPLPGEIVDRFSGVVEDLQADARDALHLLCVAGSLPVDAAGNLLGLGVIAELERRAIAVVDGDAIRPAIGAVRRVVLADLGRLGRMAVAGELLVRFPGADPTDRTRWDVESGGMPPVDDLTESARDALRRGDAHAAATLAALGVAGGSPHAALVLSEARSTLGDRRAAAEVLVQVVTDDPPLDVALAAALELSSLLLWNLDDATGALDLAATTEAAARGTPAAPIASAARASLLAYAGRRDECWTVVRSVDGDEAGPASAWVRHAEAVALAPSVSGPGSVAAARAALAPWDAGGTPGSGAQTIRSDVVGPDPEVHALTLALALELAGELEEAETVARRWYERAARRTIHHGWMALSRMRVGLASGDLGTAGRFAEEAVSVFTSLDNEVPRRWAVAGRLLVCAQRGDVSGAEASLDELDRLGGSAVTFLDPDVDRARAWGLAVVRSPSVGCAAMIEVARSAEAEGSMALASTAWHDVVRLGAAREAAARLAALRETVESRWSAPRAAHAAGVATADGPALLSVADDFAELGAGLLAAEVAAHAVVAAQKSADRQLIRRAGAALRRHRHAAGDAATPALVGVPLATLSPREREVVRWAASGASSRAVATRLGVSVRTVDNLLQRAYLKLGVSSRLELADAIDLGREQDDRSA